MDTIRVHIDSYGGAVSEGWAIYNALREHPAVPYEEDEVTRIIQDDVNETVYQKIRNWTVSDLREWILSEETSGADIRKLSRGLTSEMVAAVCKLMSNLDLIKLLRYIE